MGSVIKPTDALPGAIHEVRAASTAGGGTALTTTRALIALPKGTTHARLIPRNFSTAVVAQYLLNPWLVVLKTTDDLATNANLTDYSENAQDADAGTDITLSSLSTLANGDFLLVGADVPFAGVKVDVDAANGTASVLTVKYWNGSAWTDITVTDGSAAAGATFGQDGDITWTVPTTWTRATLRAIGAPVPSPQLRYLDDALYWSRWEVSVALDASATLNSMLAYSRSTVYGEIPTTFDFATRIHRGIGGVGCIEARTDAGTANLIVNALVQLGARGLGL